eukprot:TRINITY_DN39273_c0_g1_i1.p1 TRINITY_DN39273_c0_g1~~TRINITY_DN39273_c0_g1_i1.p1  ORF type:complete len:604 (-),score=84.47 TRINITY_DN39273_c0_g1_i1:309-2120(-)
MPLSYTEASADELVRALPSLDLPKAAAAVKDLRIGVVGGSMGGLAAAACLRRAGFTNVQVFERSAVWQRGAGIGIDDASMAILKGLGVLQLLGEGRTQRMRWCEERTSAGKTIYRQPMPYFSGLYDTVRRGLLETLPPSTVISDCKVVSAQHLADGSCSLEFSNRPAVTCDVVIAADGPRSVLRTSIYPETANMRFAFAAWRGVVEVAALPAATRSALHEQFPRFGNCLYFIWCGKPRQSAVLYDIGDDLLTWLIYENRQQPVAEPGRTTSTATQDDIARLHSQAKEQWGEALGGLICATAEPFWQDVYDLEQPLQSFVHGNLALLGDAAHAITPHMAKGSNLAIHDAFMLAHSAAEATSVEDWLRRYSDSRVKECSRTLLMSRHLGRVRNGRVPGSAQLPAGQEAVEALVGAAQLDSTTLPHSKPFEPIWQFVRQHLDESQFGFYLRRSEASRGPAGLSLTAVNHISRETADAERLRHFYKDVLGLPEIARPNFGFGGAWFQLPSGIQLHIIERDPAKLTMQGNPQTGESRDTDSLPERFIRRSHHIAVTVDSIECAKLRLAALGIPYAVNNVPATGITQLFVYDPDGNGIEIGDFDRLSKL